MSITDLIIVLIIIVTAVAGVFFVSTASNGSLEVEISVQGEAYKILKLQDSDRQVVEVNDVVVVVEHGQAFIESSGCTDKDCIHEEKISSEGQRIYCAEKDVTVEIKDSADIENAVW